MPGVTDHSHLYTKHTYNPLFTIREHAQAICTSALTESHFDWIINNYGFCAGGGGFLSWDLYSPKSKQLPELLRIKGGLVTNTRKPVPFPPIWHGEAVYLLDVRFVSTRNQAITIYNDTMRKNPTAVSNTVVGVNEDRNQALKSDSWSKLKKKKTRM